MSNYLKSFLVCLLFMGIYRPVLQAQVPMRGMPRLSGMGSGGSDSIQFEKRDFSEDSVTVQFRYLDTARFSSLDTSISDFYRRVPLKPEYVYLGNNGNAVRSILFSPNTKPGWDAGFHAFDPFAFTLEDTRFMNTTRPYTELGYLIGALAEQQISILHTQNIKPNWNVVGQYRLVNSPGAYNSQNTNHRNFRINSQYTSTNQRYNLFAIILNNGLQSSENGGIENDSFLVNKNGAFDDRFNIPTKLADSVFTTRNFFNVNLLTGNRYSGWKFMLRQQYDFGKKDSVVTDSSVYRYFLPRLRIEHSISYHSHRFLYLDVQGSADAAYYEQNYGVTDVPDTVRYEDSWKELINDFSLIQFPDAKNPLQFLKVGLTAQNLSFTNSTSGERFFNLMLHGEYRNRTRNRKWDMLLYGEFYATGRYTGDYRVQAKLKSFLSARLGYLELGFTNANRTPSYLFERQTSFPVLLASGLNRENITQISGQLEIPRRYLRLRGDYYLVSNLTYLKSFREVAQAEALFTVLRISASKEFRLGKNWRWYADLYIQLRTGDAPVNLPLIFTRNRFAYEGRVFRNLNLSTGFDLRYHTPYTADNYSPILGQFFPQTAEQISIRPDIAAYVNFRIMRFSAFARMENLHTLTFKYGFGFKDPNLAAPLYPYQDLLLRVGIFWSFVN